LKLVQLRQKECQDRWRGVARTSAAHVRRQARSRTSEVNDGVRAAGAEVEDDGKVQRPAVVELLPSHCRTGTYPTTVCIFSHSAGADPTTAEFTTGYNSGV
jgi:hypothetical protein